MSGVIGKVHYAAIANVASRRTVMACWSTASNEERGRRRNERAVRGPDINGGLDAVRDQVTCEDCIRIVERWMAGL